MTQQHPITPPPELVKQLMDFSSGQGAWLRSSREQITIAYQAGADMELEACVNYIDNNMSGNKAREFRAIRRPKPLSMKDEALAVLDDCSKHLDAAHENAIRRALEALPE